MLSVSSRNREAARATAKAPNTCWHPRRWKKAARDAGGRASRRPGSCSFASFGPGATRLHQHVTRGVQPIHTDHRRRGRLDECDHFGDRHHEHRLPGPGRCVRGRAAERPTRPDRGRRVGANDRRPRRQQGERQFFRIDQSRHDRVLERLSRRPRRDRHDQLSIQHPAGLCRLPARTGFGASQHQRQRRHAACRRDRRLRPIARSGPGGIGFHRQLPGAVHRCLRRIHQRPLLRRRPAAQRLLSDEPERRSGGIG